MGGGGGGGGSSKPPEPPLDPPLDGTPEKCPTMQRVIKTHHLTHIKAINNITTIDSP